MVLDIIVLIVSLSRRFLDAMGNKIKVIYPTDQQSYFLPDSGCQVASKYLARQSRCIDCPFSKCVKDMTLQEKNLIISRVSRLKPLPLYFLL